MTCNYKFTRVPQNLYRCMDNNCRSTLVALIQLSDYYSNSENANKEGWFFRTNAMLEIDTNLSKNVLKGALDALYQNGIIEIKPQAKGRGKNQGACHYRVCDDKFKEYDKLTFEECNTLGDYAILTSNYKKKLSFQGQLPNELPMTQQEQQPKELPNQLPQQLPIELPNQLQNDNNIDYIDKIDNKENIDNTCNNVIINNNDIVVNKDINLFSSIELSDDFLDDYPEDRDFEEGGTKEEFRNEGIDIPRVQGFEESDSEDNSNFEEVKENGGADKAESPDKSNRIEMGTPASKGACIEGENESSAAVRPHQYSKEEHETMAKIIGDRAMKLIAYEFKRRFLYPSDIKEYEEEGISNLMKHLDMNREEAKVKFEGVKEFYRGYLQKHPEYRG